MSSSGRDKLLLWVLNNPVTCKTIPKDMLPLTHYCTSLYPPSLFHTHNCHYCQVQTTADSHRLKQHFPWHSRYAVAQQIEGSKEQPFLNVISTGCCNKCEAMFNVNFVAQTTSFVVVPSGHITDDCLHPHFLVWWIWMQQVTTWLVFLTSCIKIITVCLLFHGSQSLKLHCYVSQQRTLTQMKVVVISATAEL